MCGQMEVVVSEAAGTSRVAAPAEVAPKTTGGSDIMPASGPATAFDVSEPPNIFELSNASESSAASATSGLANPSGSSMV